MVNPRAGRGRGTEVGWTVERLATEAGLEISVHRTTGPGDATRVALESAGRFAVILAVGGDGTLHEVVNGVAEAGARAGDPDAVAAVASIPTGTGNDFVKSLGGVAPDIETTFAAVRAGARRRVDAGRFRGASVGPRWFLNQIQIGYGAAVVHDLNSPRSLTRRLFPGHLAYVVAGLARITYRTRAISVRSGATERRGRFFEVHIANGRYCGGGISYATSAAVDDGALDLVAIGDLGLARIVPVMLKVRAAQPIGGPGIETERVTEVAIRDPGPFPISADGETYEITGGALDVAVAPKALDVIAVANRSAVA